MPLTGDEANDRYVAAQAAIMPGSAKKGKAKQKNGRGVDLLSKEREEKEKMTKDKEEEKKIEEEKEEKRKESEDKRKEEMEEKKKQEEKKEKKKEERKKEEEEKKKNDEKEEIKKRRKYEVVECVWAEEVDKGGHECSFGGCAHFHEREERVDLNPCGKCMFNGNDGGRGFKYDTRPGSKWSCVKCSQVRKKQCFSKELS